MKITPRRQRSDSAKAAAEAMKTAAKGTLQPPAYVTLREQDRPYWKAIIEARAASTWTESDLVNAATMARAQADIEELQKKLDNEGYIIDGKPHAAVKILDTLSKRVMALSRMLHVHAQATVGRSADASKALQLEREAKAALENDDGLIPSLRVV